MPLVAGDECSDAIDISSLPSPAFFLDTTNATTDGPDLAPNCDPGPGLDDQIYGDVWYTYEVPADGSYLIEVVPFVTSARFAVYASDACRSIRRPSSPAERGNSISFARTPVRS